MEAEENTHTIKTKNILLVKLLEELKHLIDIDTSTEFKISKKEKAGLLQDDIVYYWIDKKSNIRIASLKHRELTKYVGVVKKEKWANAFKKYVARHRYFSNRKM